MTTILKQSFKNYALGSEMMRGYTTDVSFGLAESQPIHAVDLRAHLLTTVACAFAGWLVACTY